MLDKFEKDSIIQISHITGLKNMKKQSISYLSKRQKILTERLISKLPHIMRGSLIKTYKRCGKKGCKCEKGRGHGPKYYLSVSQSGGERPKIEYVSKESREHVERCISNFRAVKKCLEEISSINRKILKRKKSL